jgi:hypothetical protein
MHLDAEMSECHGELVGVDLPAAVGVDEAEDEVGDRPKGKRVRVIKW